MVILTVADVIAWLLGCARPRSRRSGRPRGATSTRGPSPADGATTRRGSAARSISSPRDRPAGRPANKRTIARGDGPRGATQFRAPPARAGRRCALVEARPHARAAMPLGVDNGAPTVDAY